MKRLLTSCFGFGWLPLAPGSWGSLPPTIIFALMGVLWHGLPARENSAKPVLSEVEGMAEPLSISIVMAALALAGSVICVRFAPAVITATGKNDPGEIVADEIAGQSVTFLAVGFLAIETFSTWQILGTAALGFFLFRLLDTIKPWPIRKLEKLPEGWGVLADDLMAGVYAGVALLLCLSLYARWSVK